MRRSARTIRDYLALNDLKFTIKLTPNKADCLSVLGVAREVSALTGTPLHPAADPFRAGQRQRNPAGEDQRAGPVWPLLPGSVIRGLNAKAATPDWIRQRLERSGQRPLSALVDISNYVMLELGRPSHVFDMDKIHGGARCALGQGRARP